MKENRYSKSVKKFRESTKYIIPGTPTISKNPYLYTLGAYPIYIEKAEGAIVTDIDGNAYIDFQSALGPIILGYNYSSVQKAVEQQLKKGVLFPLASTLQIDLAKQISSIIPSAEMIRFFKTGSDATTGAVKLARAFTGKTKIASCHFHGWHDWYYVSTGATKGIPERTKDEIFTFEYNNIDSLKKIFEENKGEMAAIIMEPVNFEEPKEGYLDEVKKLAHENGALLIFDEVVTGFRFKNGSAQSYFGCIPDLTCLAKAMGNGYPIAAVAGRRDIFQATADVVTTTTYGEGNLSFAAAIATLTDLKNKSVAEHIWKLGAELKEGFNTLAKKYQLPVECIGYPCRLEFSFGNFAENSRKQVKSFFLQETAKRGIIFGMHIYLTFAHTKEHIKETLSVCDEVFKVMQKQKTLHLDGEEVVELW